MDLNTWFNVQQAAIQSILSPDTLGKEAVSDYLKVRFGAFVSPMPRSPLLLLLLVMLLAAEAATAAAALMLLLYVV